MIKILTSVFFTYFIVTLITTVFSVFVKSVSRNDSHRSLKNEDFAIGLELSVTALILFIADSVAYTQKILLTESALSAEYNKIVVIPWIIFSFIFGIWIISTIIRKKGWESENKLKIIPGIIIPNLFGFLSLIFVVYWINN